MEQFTDRRLRYDEAASEIRKCAKERLNQLQAAGGFQEESIQVRDNDKGFCSKK